MGEKRYFTNAFSVDGCHRLFARFIAELSSTSDTRSMINVQNENSSRIINKPGDSLIRWKKTKRKNIRRNAFVSKRSRRVGGGTWKYASNESSNDKNIQKKKKNNEVGKGGRDILQRTGDRGQGGGIYVQRLRFERPRGKRVLLSGSGRAKHHPLLRVRNMSRTRFMRLKPFFHLSFKC